MLNIIETSKSEHINFDVIERSTGQCLLHKDFPIWVVHYPDPGHRAPFYQVYKPAPGVKQIKGRRPWTLDNVAISKHGFSTLEDAIEAALALEGK